MSAAKDIFNLSNSRKQAGGAGSGELDHRQQRNWWQSRIVTNSRPNLVFCSTNFSIDCVSTTYLTSKRYLWTSRLHLKSKRAKNRPPSLFWTYLLLESVSIYRRWEKNWHLWLIWKQANSRGTHDWLFGLYICEAVHILLHLLLISYPNIARLNTSNKKILKFIQLN